MTTSMSATGIGIDFCPWFLPCAKRASVLKHCY